MNGPTCAQEIQKLGSNVLIVGITGNMLREDVDFFKSCGAHFVLPKPFELPLLETLWQEHGITNDGHSSSNK